MKSTSLLLPFALGVALLAGCGRDDRGGPDASGDSTADTADASAGVGASDAATDAAAGDDGFDVTSVPLSTAPLGDFPYITVPAGYSTESRIDRGKDYARFPFWVKGEAHWVEGRFHEFNFDADEGKSFSRFEVQKNLEALVERMGGVKLSEGRIPNETIEEWGDEITRGFIGGLGDIYNDPAATYLIRREDGNIWIHFVANTAEGSVIVGREEGFEATAGLVPASELQDQLARDGRVALEVNFAVDRTEILDESLPQIEEVVALLEEDAALQLAVNGHTDNTGEAARNRALSEGRAASVVAAVTARGIESERLVAAGFGDTQPVADNGDEAGRARNRRVELVRL